MRLPCGLLVLLKALNTANIAVALSDLGAKFLYYLANRVLQVFPLSGLFLARAMDPILTPMAKLVDSQR